MKISKLFHWLYALVMFLPLFVLPIYAFAVRSDNNYEPISVNIGGYDIEPLYTSNQPSSVNDLVVNNIYSFSYDTDNLNVGDNQELSFGFYIVSGSIILDDDGVDDSDFYDDVYTKNTLFELHLTSNSETLYMRNGFYMYILSNYTYTEDLVIQFLYDINTSSDLDLTLFFSHTDFNVLIASWNDSHVYNDTDFGSQTIYTLYKEVDTYFNYDNVLSIGDLYQWCEINLFNGNATLGFFIFFHLLEYWLLTSLLWLIFDVLMYVPQLCHRWLDKASLE